MEDKKLVYPILIIITVAILLIIGVVIYDNRKYTNLSVKEGGTGNVLCEYVVIAAYYIANEKDVKCHDINEAGSIFSWLPTEIKYKKKWKHMSSELRQLISNMTYIDIFTTKYSDWKVKTGILCIMQNWYQSIVRSRLPSPKTYHNVIIHYRCSDSPFNHCIHYEMVKYGWYLKAIKLASQYVDITNITILACYQHNSNVCRANICDIYANDLKDYISQRVDAEVEIDCGSVADDFLAMTHAECLISPSSSLSFMAGYGSDNIFIYGEDSKFLTNYSKHRGYREGMIALSSDPYIIPHGNIDYVKQHQEILQKLRS